MNNSQLGLAHMLESADAVIWLTAVVLLLMSIVSWTIIVSKGRATQKLRQSISARAHQFWQSDSLHSGLAQLRAQEPSPVLSSLVVAAIELKTNPASGTLEEQSGRDERVTRTLRGVLQSTTARLDSGLVTLASIGATAPFVGLFGTVWSIYHALVNISGSGQIMIEQVAGPVGEALIMTAFGLFVAIPAVLAYNALTKSNRLILAAVDGFANDLRTHLLREGS